MREVGFEWISRWDAASVCTRSKHGNGKAVSLEGGIVGSECSGFSSQSVLGGAARRQRNDGVGNAVVGAVVDAADCAGEVDDAVRLTALENGETYERPAINEVAFERMVVYEVGQREYVIEIDHVRAVEIG